MAAFTSTLSPGPPKEASSPAIAARSQGAGPERSAWPARAWARRLARVLIAAGLFSFAVVDVRSFAGAADDLRRLQVGWLALALGAEAASLASFALLQRALLLSTGTPRGLGRVVAVTLAGAAVGKSLPGGGAAGGLWVYRQLRRRGVGRAPAVWVLLASGAVSYFALFVVVVVGIELAGRRGPLAPLRGVAAGLAGLPLAAGLAWAVRSRFPALSAKANGLGRWGRPLACAVAKARTAKFWPAAWGGHPGAWGWSRALGWALANWALDAAVLVVSIKALGGEVPWEGALVAYGFAQVAGSLPLTPGGLGTVEASLAGLLVAYGMQAPEALAAVVLYRAVGFGVVALVGTSAWSHLRRRPSQEPLSSCTSVTS